MTMFYLKNEIECLLKCSACQLRFEETVKVLPCGRSICMKCVDNLEVTSNGAPTEFKCPVCSRSHEIPREGLVTNESMMQLLAQRPKEVYRGPAVEELKKQLDELDAFNNELKCSVSECEKTVLDYCENIRHELDYATVRALEHINNLSRALHGRISEYESELLEALQCENSPLVRFRDEFGPLMKERDDLNAKWAHELTQASLNQKEIKCARDKASVLKSRVAEALASLKSIVFKQKFLRIESNSAFTERSDYLARLTIIEPEKPNLGEFVPPVLQNLCCPFANSGFISNSSNFSQSDVSGQAQVFSSGQCRFKASFLFQGSRQVRQE